MKCLFKCFKTKIIKYLDFIVIKNLITWAEGKVQLNRIYAIAWYGRFDLIDIIYRETNIFLNNACVLDFAASRGNLDAVRFLTELGA